jgi:DNA-binding NarL/FixJ family response regulator
MLNYLITFILSGRMINLIIACSFQPIRDLVKEFLSSDSNIRIIGEANNLRELTELVIRLKPDLLITDILVDGENSLGTIKILKEQASSTRVIIWACSICAGSMYAKAAVDAGANSYVPMDSGFRELMTAIQEVYKGQNYISGCIQ